jgi:16S rRNA (cytosine1402-N4)-methyltransferase
MEHKPVMVNEVIESLNLAPGKIILDCTIGTGGHSLNILKHILPKGKLIGIDRDNESLEYARNRLKDFSKNVILIHEDFRNLDKVLDSLKINKVDGMLFDLGVSSFQLESPERGFSIKINSPLDMRMDRSSFISAYDLINNLTENEISSILKTFGQERWHKRIAKYLVRERSFQPIATTGQLTSIVLKALPYTSRYSRIHPATRTFQAFRIAVNRELESLEEGLEKSIEYLNVGGRNTVISFHSLEDRIVKNTFRKFSNEGRAKLIYAKPQRPQDKEVKSNPRARSAKLRTIEKIK